MAALTAPGTAVVRERVVEATAKEQGLIQAVLSGRYRQILFGGGIRGGKTWGSLLTMFLLCRVFPGSRWAIIRKDLPTLRKNVVPSFEKLRPASFCAPFNRTDWTARCRNGSEILLFPESLDVDPELNRMKGLEVNGIVFDEGNECSERTFNKAIERAGAWIIPGTDVQPPPIVLTTCNPSPGWVKRLFYDPWKADTLPPHRLFLPATAADNPHIPDALRQAWLDMPERDYQRYVMGEWDDLTGAALEELDETRHFVEPFDIPKHWPVFAAFDWGFSHAAVWMWAVSDERGNVVVVKTTRLRRMRDDQLAQAIIEDAPPDFVGRVSVIEAGHDCWAEAEAKRSDRTPSTAEVFADAGLALHRANVARIQGLNNLRQWLAWRPAKPGLPTRTPRLRFFRNVSNVRAFDRLKEIVVDPDRPEDALKVDADPETGEGGDDDYDCLRYLMAGRPWQSSIAPLDPSLTAFSPEVLAWESERKRLGLPVVPDPSERPNAPVRITRHQPRIMTRNGGRR